MAEPQTLHLDASQRVALPVPPMTITDGTVVVRLCLDREGTEIHQSLTWHVQIRGAVWSQQPTLGASAQAHLANIRRAWVLVSYAGRRVGECRVTVTR